MGLRAHPAVGIHQQDRDVAVGCGNSHIAGVLLVAGGVGNKNPATVGQVHVPIGDIDRDALLALGFEAIGEQRVVDLPHRDRRSTAPCPTRVLELVNWNRIGLREESADQCRLAVVDRTASDQVQNRSGVH